MPREKRNDHFSEAMDNGQGGSRRQGTHPLPVEHGSSVHATRETQRSVQRGDGQQITEVRGVKARTFCEPSKKGACMPREKRNGQSIGAMDNGQGGSGREGTHPLPVEQERSVHATRETCPRPVCSARRRTSACRLGGSAQGNFPR